MTELEKGNRLSHLIQLNQIYKHYHVAEKSFTALRNVNLNIDKGDFLAVIGKSGSGKSTLMNILGFLDVASDGQYFFDNNDVSTLSDDELAAIRNDAIGFVFQSFFLLPRINIVENVMLPLFYRGIPRNEAKRKAMFELDRLGLENMSTKYPNQLSGGQQQRVAIARALVGNPAIILADEPTGSLDSQTSDDIMQLLAKLNHEGRTILIITHDPCVSEQCKRVIKIQDGCLFDA